MKQSDWRPSDQRLSGASVPFATVLLAVMPLRLLSKTLETMAVKSKVGVEGQLVALTTVVTVVVFTAGRWAPTSPRWASAIMLEMREDAAEASAAVAKAVATESGVVSAVQPFMQTGSVTVTVTVAEGTSSTNSVAMAILAMAKERRTMMVVKSIFISLRMMYCFVLSVCRKAVSTSGLKYGQSGCWQNAAL